MNAMTASEITEIVTVNKGNRAMVTTMAPTPNGPGVTGTLIGTLISINSKGVNVKTEDGTVVSRSLSRVAWVEIDAEDMDEDTEADFIADMVDAGVYEDDEIEVAAAEDGIANLDLPNDQDALVAELDGATTAELADVFGIVAKELRVTLRSLGMGVGKGRRYHLTSDQINTVRVALAPANT